MLNNFVFGFLSICFAYLVICARPVYPCDSEKAIYDIEHSAIAVSSNAVHLAIGKYELDKAKKLLYEVVLPEFESIKKRSKTSDMYSFSEAYTYPLMDRLENYFESKGRYKDAEQIVRDKLRLTQIYRRLDALDNYTSTKLNLCRLLIAQKRFAEAEPLMTQCVGEATFNDLRYGYYNYHLVQNLRNLATWYKQQGRINDAEAALNDARIAEKRGKPRT